MVRDFQETTYEDTLQLLNVIAKHADFIQSEYFLIAFGYWHGSCVQLRQISKKYRITILDCSKRLDFKKGLIKDMVAWCLSGRYFVIVMEDLSQIVEVYCDLLKFLSIHFYFLDKSDEQLWLSYADKANYEKQNFDEYLSFNSKYHFGIRIDTDAVCESGFTQEIFYNRLPNFLVPYMQSVDKNNCACINAKWSINNQ